MVDEGLFSMIVMKPEEVGRIGIVRWEHVQ
jgi:hypothetical protein